MEGSKAGSEVGHDFYFVCCDGGAKPTVSDPFTDWPSQKLKEGSALEEEIRDSRGECCEVDGGRLGS
jgi:hypothetical protein